jgi:hypothetical protein
MRNFDGILFRKWPVRKPRSRMEDDINKYARKIRFKDGGWIELLHNRLLPELPETFILHVYLFISSYILNAAPHYILTDLLNCC